jgi:hypothetical protein
MFLRRVYDTNTGEFQYLKAISVSQTQKFTQPLINQLIGEGLCSVSKGVITIHTEPQELRYRVVAIPGYYCCFDNTKLADQFEARKYVAENFAGQESPDPQNPAGYRNDAFFLCELINEDEVANNG